MACAFGIAALAACSNESDAPAITTAAPTTSTGSVVNAEPGPAPQLVETTIAELQAALVAGDTTCRNIVQGYLNRIETYDESSGINAITVVNVNALNRADEIDAALAAGAELVFGTGKGIEHTKLGREGGRV